VKIPIDRIKARMHLPDRASAYKESTTQKFALSAVVDILLEVNKQDGTATNK
jgi:hypothetical protein